MRFSGADVPPPVARRARCARPDHGCLRDREQQRGDTADPVGTPVPTLAGVGALPDTVPPNRAPLVMVRAPLNEDGTTVELIGVVAEGNRVLLIGDSILASTSSRSRRQMCDTLVPLGWQVAVEAEPSRFVDFGTGCSTRCSSTTPSLPTTGTPWSSSSGSNYGGDEVRYEAELRRILDRLARAAATLPLTVTEYRSSYVEVNEVVRRLGAEYDNTHGRRLEDTGGDAGRLEQRPTHPTESGREVLRRRHCGRGSARSGSAKAECLRSVFRDDSVVTGHRRVERRQLVVVQVVVFIVVDERTRTTTTTAPQSRPRWADPQVLQAPPAREPPPRPPWVPVATATRPRRSGGDERADDVSDDGATTTAPTVPATTATTLAPAPPPAPAPPSADRPTRRPTRHRPVDRRADQRGASSLDGCSRLRRSRWKWVVGPRRRRRSTVMPRDKVGIVGRNGPGKTTCSRCSAVPLSRIGQGAAQGRGRRPPTGPEDRLGARRASRVTDVLSGRGIDDEITRIEKLRIAMEENPDERNVGRYVNAEEAFRNTGRYAVESEARAMAEGRGIPDARPTSRSAHCPAASGAEWNSPAPVRRFRRAGSDEPTKHLDVDDEDLAARLPAPVARRAARDSDDLDLLDESITRVLDLDRRPSTTSARSSRPWHLQPVPACACRGRGPPRQEGGAAGQRDRPAPDRRRPLRCEGHQGCDGRQRREAHRPPRDTTRPWPAGDEDDGGPGPDAPKCGETVIRSTGLRRPTVVPRSRGHQLRPRRGERLLVLGPNGAARPAAAHPRRRDHRRSRRLRVRRPCARRKLREEHDKPAHRRARITNIRDAVPEGTNLARPNAGLPACRPVGRQGVRGRARCPAARRRSPRWRCRRSGATLLLLDEPTNNLDPPSRQAVADAPTTGPARHPREPRRGLRARARTDQGPPMPDGDVDDFSDDWLDLDSMSDDSRGRPGHQGSGPAGNRSLAAGGDARSYWSLNSSSTSPGSAWCLVACSENSSRRRPRRRSLPWRRCRG